MLLNPNGIQYLPFPVIALVGGPGANVPQLLWSYIQKWVLVIIMYFWGYNFRGFA
jgi:hypothetical protein